jgi:hypothetical protein
MDRPAIDEIAIQPKENPLDLLQRLGDVLVKSGFSTNASVRRP